MRTAPLTLWESAPHNILSEMLLVAGLGNSGSFSAKRLKVFYPEFLSLIFLMIGLF